MFLQNISQHTDSHAHTSAHAAAAPWEAQNALDAAFLAYSAVSVLRQQIHPSHRVHGIVTGKDWAPNGQIITSLFAPEALLLTHLDLKRSYT